MTEDLDGYGGGPSTAYKGYDQTWACKTVIDKPTFRENVEFVILTAIGVAFLLIRFVRADFDTSDMEHLINLSQPPIEFFPICIKLLKPLE